MKKCCTCGIEKELSEFYKRAVSPDKHGAVCKECKRVYIRKHYENNKQYYFIKANEATKRARNKISKLKDRPCADCGQNFPSVCMDFDHVRGIKCFNIAQGIGRESEETILKEIKKCDVVCANCHRIRTAKRLRARSAANSATLS